MVWLLAGWCLTTPYAYLWLAFAIMNFGGSGDLRLGTTDQRPKGRQKIETKLEVESDRLLRN